MVYILLNFQPFILCSRICMSLQWKYFLWWNFYFLTFSIFFVYKGRYFEFIDRDPFCLVGRVFIVSFWLWAFQLLFDKSLRVWRTNRGNGVIVGLKKPTLGWKLNYENKRNLCWLNSIKIFKKLICSIDEII